MPPGKPAALGPGDLDFEEWRLEGDVAHLPTKDLDTIITNSSRWRAWARALEKAGRWRQPKGKVQ